MLNDAWTIGSTESKVSRIFSDSSRALLAPSKSLISSFTRAVSTVDAASRISAETGSPVATIGQLAGLQLLHDLLALGWFGIEVAGVIPLERGFQLDDPVALLIGGGAE